jgi:hypothetical protein
MEKNQSDNVLENVYFNMRILQEIYPERPTLTEMKTVEMGQFLRASNAVHFVMQTIVAAKFNELSDVPPEPVEKSAFDDYDRENGYDDEPEVTSVWRSLKESVDRVIKIGTRILNTGYDECMKSDIMTLLEYVRFEIDTVDENKE